MSAQGRRSMVKQEKIEGLRVGEGVEKRVAAGE